MPKCPLKNCSDDGRYFFKNKMPASHEILDVCKEGEIPPSPYRLVFTSLILTLNKKSNQF